MDNFTNDFTYNIKPNVEGEYIFLDDEERRRFAVFDHELLIEQVKKVDSRLIINSGDHYKNLVINNLIKTMYWIFSCKK